MNAPDKLRFGILLNELSVQCWQAECVDFLLGDDRISLELLVLPLESKNTPGNKKWQDRLDKHAAYKLFRKYRMRVTGLETCKPEWLEKTPEMRCSVVQKGHSQFFEEEDVERIRSHRLDFILRFGFNILRGKILQSARFGIWSFHHGDEQHYRGGPPALWEIMHGRPACGSILQRLTEKLDAGIVLKKGFFQTSLHSLSETHDVLLHNTAMWPLQVARDLLNGVTDFSESKPTATDAPIYRFPENGDMLLFWYRLLRNQIKFHWRQLFLPEQWNVGVVDQPLETIIERGIEQVKWLPRQSSRYFRADPFGFVDGDETYLLFEDYDQRAQRGTISALDSAGKMLRIFPASKHHHSYPFIFEYDGNTYCLPESFESNGLNLYRWDRQQKEFVFDRTLMEDVQLADPTLCEIEGKWWLFCTHKSLSNTALYLYHASSPFGPFTEHTNNPVKWNIHSSRPAGHLFLEKGKWYRPAQDCSTSYGSKIVLNQIDEITPNSFREHAVKCIDPIAPYDRGLHTVSRLGNKTLIDGKIYRFSSAQFWRQISRKISRLLRR